MQMQGQEVELSFRTGDIITVFGEMDDDGFYMAELRGQRGLVPSNFLTEAPGQYTGGMQMQGQGQMMQGQMMGGPGMQGMVRPGQFATVCLPSILQTPSRLCLCLCRKDKDEVFQPPLCVQLQH